MKTFEFEDLVLALPDGESNFDKMEGGTYLFYGVDCNAFKLNDAVYEALEDEDDGYRSYLGSIELKGNHSFTFFKQPLARVRVVAQDETSLSGFNFVDIQTGHIWLTIGTDNNDEYYPCFIFDYQPDKSQTTIIFE